MISPLMLRSMSADLQRMEKMVAGGALGGLALGANRAREQRKQDIQDAVSAALRQQQETQ